MTQYKTKGNCQKDTEPNLSLTRECMVDQITDAYSTLSRRALETWMDWPLPEFFFPENAWNK